MEEGEREGEGRERKCCCGFLARWLGDHEHRQVALLQLLFTDWLKYMCMCTGDALLTRCFLLSTESMLIYNLL